MKTSPFSNKLSTALLVGTVLLAAVLPACDLLPIDPLDPPKKVKKTVVDGSGDITDEVDAFRALLGDPLNTTVGVPPVGRREINWDAVPDPFTNVDTFPGDFFNSIDPADPDGRKRGAVFATTGTGFRVSDNDFADVNATYDAQFNFFSPIRTFSPVGSNVTDVTFRLPGTDTPASVEGFGAVFSDVDQHKSAKLDFYGYGGHHLGTFNVPPRSDAEGLSFLGVVFKKAMVVKVRITTGDGALGAHVKDVSDGGSLDLVVLDDFLYSEPRPYASNYAD